MKRLIAVFVTLAVLCIPLMPADSWNSRVITITAGTAIRVVPNSIRVNSILVQMLTGGTGRGYVLNADPQYTCGKTSPGTAWVAELAPASSTAPGSSVTIPSNGSATTQAGGQDLQWFCVDGTNSSDTVLVSWNPRN